ncbi:RNA 2',3'-cyclic phosphodiesterase [Streptomyces sp. NPDC004856]|uniref:RNA 2',3'-cyclic phosphodiesterase n=1 Tax=unclassified Streptomyces TaxID=2593676 RepID=UPI0033B45501
MRLFAAVVPPDAALGELSAAVGTPPGTDGLRWTERSAWHLTLAFYGDVPDDTVPELTRRLARAAARTAPFALALRGGGHFGGRTLWTGVTGDVTALRRLAERAEAAGRKSGLPGEHRHYRPHLTLARSRTPRDLGPYVTALDAFAGGTWTVPELTLVRSRLPGSGVPGERPRYDKVDGWRLSGPG